MPDLAAVPSRPRQACPTCCRPCPVRRTPAARRGRIPLVHVVLIVDVASKASDAELQGGLATAFGPNRGSAYIVAQELSARWSSHLLYSSVGPTFSVYCIRNVPSQLQFHLEPGSDDTWRTAETAWSAVRSNLKRWKPKLNDAQIVDGRTNEIVMNGRWRSRLRDTAAADVAVICVGLASVGLVAAGAATGISEIPAYVSGAVVSAAVFRRLTRTRIVWRSHD